MEKIALTMVEAAKVVGVSVPVMREIANRKGFPAIKTGRRWIIPCDSLKRWLEEEAAKGVRGAR